MFEAIRLCLKLAMEHMDVVHIELFAIRIIEIYGICVGIVFVKRLKKKIEDSGKTRFVFLLFVLAHIFFSVSSKQWFVFTVDLS